MKTDREIYQINKIIPKLSRWFKNDKMICSQILINYLKLNENDGSVEYETLADTCKHLKTFKENFAQMKNFGQKNHGKIFDVIDSKITLWKPIEKDIYREYDSYKKTL
tara:strand:+ start:222 stop:545 length:324 start_codon:yes stop_codon:yes gene_type:complete